MTAHRQAIVAAITYELGELRRVEDICAIETDIRRVSELLQKGLKTVSCLGDNGMAAIQRCALATLDKLGLEAGEIDAVLWVSESFNGVVEANADQGESEFRTFRNLVFDTLAEIGIVRARMFCNSFGGSSNLLQSLFFARDLIEANRLKNILILCYDRVPTGVSRVMDAAVSLTGDGVAACLLAGTLPTSGPAYGIDYIGITPYELQSSRGDMSQMVLEMYRASKGAAADCYDSLMLQPHDFGTLIVSNYNEQTSRLFNRLLGFNSDSLFLHNVGRTGHIPTCDVLINLQDLWREACPERILLYSNGPISCGVMALSRRDVLA